MYNIEGKDRKLVENYSETNIKKSNKEKFILVRTLLKHKRDENEI